MSQVVNLHPQLSKPEVMRADVDGGYVMNVAAALQLARDGDTPQCRSLTRFYAAEYRALEGQPLAPAAREWAAFEGAWRRLVRKFGVPPLGEPTPL
jgi:hypothetical protein